MLKAYAVALVLSTTAPVVTAEQGAKPLDNTQEAATQYQKVLPCKWLNACPGEKIN
ncbi:hypothetical protein [Alteromonas sp. C1M14]|uniref:hypothetical protein n=1 Tax=Alteromonas sp. C1M14 TaxID=2841567 RepID=UPI001C0824FD|nr:hypothetical protein [Alteromonas sp. C1M14]MBU2977366.1 hypothetical protein [Alteromonas sp. C1M14]